eukprot:4506102-Alexandrium_andersonii.AAC.1
MLTTSPSTASRLSPSPGPRGHAAPDRMGPPEVAGSRPRLAGRTRRPPEAPGRRVGCRLPPPGYRSRP